MGALQQQELTHFRDRYHRFKKAHPEMDFSNAKFT